MRLVDNFYIKLSGGDAIATENNTVNLFQSLVPTGKLPGQLDVACKIVIQNAFKFDQIYLPF